MSRENLAKNVIRPALTALIADARAARERVLAGSQLPRGAGAAHDQEAIHDFRVALRRLRTLLRVARALYGRKRLARIEAELKYYAQTTGGLRDEEALGETLTALPLPEAARAEVGGWLVRRAHAARSRRTLVERLLRDGPPTTVIALPTDKPVRPLDRCFDKLAEILEVGDADHLSTEDLGESALSRARSDVAARAEADVRDAEAMHVLRIREKRLRYTAELFAAPLGAETAHLAKRAARMQRRLGELHDLDEAITKVGRARGLARATRSAVLAALRAARSARELKLAEHLVEERRIASDVVSDETTARPSGDTSPRSSSP
jgi:CHAD domain-containing protein